MAGGMGAVNLAVSYHTRMHEWANVARKISMRSVAKTSPHFFLLHSTPAKYCILPVPIIKHSRVNLRERDISFELGLDLREIVG